MLRRVLPIWPMIVLLALPFSAAGQAVEEDPGEPSQEIESTEGDGDSDLARVERMILDGVNKFRESENRAPIIINSKLDDASEYFAGYMARTDKYGHEADGKKPAQRAKDHDYEYCIVLENIAWASHSEGFAPEALTEQLVTGWKNSPGHRKNMLDPDVSDTGIAVARSPQSGKYYGVQMFGRPRSAMIRFKISNRSSAVVEYRTGNRVFTVRPRYTRTHGACRSPSVVFPIPPAQTPATQPSDSGGSTLRPTDGTHYVIRDGPGGDLKLEER